MSVVIVTGSTGLVGSETVRYYCPVVLLAVIAAPFVDLGPSYFSIRRIYIMPVPYLLAAFGVAGVSFALSRVTGVVLPRLRGPAMVIVMVTVAIAAAAEQAYTSNRSIFEKYRSDKAADMYYKLYYGHYYGRSYKELGSFILEDAPRKVEGQYRTALVYTIPEDSKIGRSLPLFNTVNWYTANQVMTLHDFKKKSMELYGTPELLRGYIERLFASFPRLEVIYFVDFNDSENNYSYFSGAHPYLEPYAMVDDDDLPAFDSILFRFDRFTWKAALDRSRPLSPDLSTRGSLRR